MSDEEAKKALSIIRIEDGVAVVDTGSDTEPDEEDSRENAHRIAFAINLVNAYTRDCIPRPTGQPDASDEVVRRSKDFASELFFWWPIQDMTKAETASALEWVQYDGSGLAAVSG